MKDWKRFLGLDAFDAVVHIALTGILALLLASRDPATQKASDYLVLTGASLVVFAIRRRIALGLGRRAEGPSGEDADGRLTSDVESRLAELEALYGRVAELEERLDFTERILAAKTEPARLEAPR